MKIDCCCSGGMPGPLSETCISITSAPRKSPNRSGLSVLIAIRPVAGPMACTAFCTRLISTCLSCSASPFAFCSDSPSSSFTSIRGGRSLAISLIVRVTTSLMSVGPKLCFSGRE